MQLNEQTTGSVSVLALSGRFERSTAPDVNRWLDTVVGQRGRVVIDLVGVTFLDSSALAVLVGGMKRCRQVGGDVRLCGLQQPVRIIFELTRIDGAFEIYPGRDEAVMSFDA